MRKLTERRRRWLALHAHRSDIRRIYSAAKRKALRTGWNVPRIGDPRWNRLAAPSNFNLEEDYENVVSFLAQVDSAFLENRGRVFVDLAPIRQLGTAAALTLAATLDLWQEARRRKLIALGAHMWRPDVRTMLVDLGLFDLLRTHNPPQRDTQAGTPPATKMLKFCSGKNSDGSLARRLGDSMVVIAGPIDAKLFLYAGLTEAMTNVCQHAYTDDLPQQVRRWWMTGSFDAASRRMRIVILDLGVSIPKTLPRSRKWEQIRGILSKLNVNDDAAMIEAAVEAGRSSIATAGRGLGLDEVRHFVDNSHAGRLRILSRHGEVIYEKGVDRPVRRTLTTAFRGTLIEWDVFR